MKKFFCVVTLLAAAGALFAAPTLQQNLRQLEADNPIAVVHLTVENDFQQLGEVLNRVWIAYAANNPQLPPFPVQVNTLLGRLGLTQWTSFTNVTEFHAASSGIRNRSLFTFAQSPSGLFLLSGAENRDFEGASLLPADTDFYWESHLQLDQVANTVRGIAGDLMGSLGIELVNSQLNAAFFSDQSTLQELIEHVSAVLVVGMRSGLVNSESVTAKHKRAEESLWVLRLRGAGSVMPRMVELARQFFPPENQPLRLLDKDLWALHGVRENADRWLIYSGDASGDLLLVNCPQALDWMRGSTLPLDQNAAFKRVIEPLASSGVARWFSSRQPASRAFEALRAATENSNPELAPLLAPLWERFDRSAVDQGGVAFLGDGFLQVDSVHPGSGRGGLGMVALLVSRLLLEPFITDEAAATTAETEH